jgi:hypothetical protein
VDADNDDTIFHVSRRSRVGHLKLKLTPDPEKINEAEGIFYLDTRLEGFLREPFVASIYISKVFVPFCDLFTIDQSEMMVANCGVEVDGKFPDCDIVGDHARFNTPRAYTSHRPDVFTTHVTTPIHSAYLSRIH